MIDRLKKDPNVLEKLAPARSIALNYAWYLKEYKNKAFIEISFNDTIARMGNVKFVAVKEEAYPLLANEAQKIREYLAQIGSNVHPEIFGYYMKGEKQEFQFGLL